MVAQEWGLSEALMTEKKWIKTWSQLHQKEEGLRLYCARRLVGGWGAVGCVWRRFHEEGGVELTERLSSQAADGDGRDSMPPLDRHEVP